MTAPVAAPSVLTSGAVLDLLRQAAATLEIEANGVSDNPLIFPDTGEALSGGNFHAEPVAFAADMIALALCETGSIAERRIAMLIDAGVSRLPPFLSAEPGLNSGFMIAHVTAASLASENKSLAHPASVDSLPTSANQEDHVSMGWSAARKLRRSVDGLRTVLAIEVMTAARALDLRRPRACSPATAAAVAALRVVVAGPGPDRVLSEEIEASVSAAPAVLAAAEAVTGRLD